MSRVLQAGENITLPSGVLELGFDAQSRCSLDLCAYLLTAARKVRGDGDIVFYNQAQSENGALSLFGPNFTVQLEKIPAEIESLVFCATLEGDPPLDGVVSTLKMRLTSDGQRVATAEIAPPAGRKESSLILCELYRRQGAWKLRWIDQGFFGGLKPLCEYYGVEVADETAPPQPAVSLSKITLDKTRPSVSLKKKNEGFGEIAVNLNWHRGPKKGLFSGFTGGGAIDLDLAALVRLQDGSIDLVQALGQHLGDLQRPPYVRLDGDDRSGDSADGEWLRINGAHWDDIAQVVVFCFIYEGAANWAQTDGVVRIEVPEQSVIEVALTEGDDRLRLCGICELKNVQGSIEVKRVVEYFSGHPELDRRFHFGFHWVKGRK